jgi:glutamate racemase
LEIRLKEELREKPIGIFDSGVGGLTVLKEIINKLPGENTIYLGDTARVPYGIRSPETVLKYSFENTRFLMSRNIKLLVVACNTSSSVGLSSLKREFPIPVIGVVEPGARAAVANTRIRKIAVIGTETTIKSNAYKDAIQYIDKSAEVVGIACPLFVPLIEEGWISGDIVSLTAKKYLSEIKNNGVDTLVLGCTHYPLIKYVIEDIVKLPLIDSAHETAKEVQRILTENKMLRDTMDTPGREFFVTDAPDKFARTGQRFLGNVISDIKRITVGG